MPDEKLSREVRPTPEISEKHYVPHKSIKDETAHFANRTDEPVKELPVKTHPKMVTVINCNLLNIRSGPSLESDVVTVISSGSELLLMESDQNNEIYVKICTAAGIEGFVNKAFVKR